MKWNKISYQKFLKSKALYSYKCTFDTKYKVQIEINIAYVK